MSNETLEEVNRGEIVSYKNKYEALRLENFQLKHRLDNLKYLENIIGPKLEVIKTEIANKFGSKKSGQSVVFNHDGERFCDPIIVNTDDVEEALCPEDDSYERGFFIPIPSVKDFKEL